MKMIKKTAALVLGLVLMGGAASFAQSLADAKKAIDAEQYQKATSMLKTLVANQAKSGDNYYNLGRVYLLTDDVDSAKIVFNNGVTADAKNPLNYVGLGQADLMQNNAAAAKANFDKAIQLGAKNYLTYLAIGRAYIDQKNPDYVSALPNLQKADELDSKDKDADVFLALADYWAQQKKNTEAYPQYLRALDINPALSRANVQIGKMYKEAYAFPESEAALKKVIEADPNYGPAYRELAELNMQWSDFDPKNGAAKRNEALENYRKYLDLTDKSFESRLRYAQFLVYANDFATLEKEVATLQAPDANNPKTFIVTRMRGYSAIENKNYEQGIKYMNELFNRKQDASRILGSDYLYLGKAEQAVGQDSLAFVNITKAIELDSTKYEALGDLAKKYFDNKNYKKAADAYRILTKANSKNPNLAMAYFFLGYSNYFDYAFADQAHKNPSRDLLVEADAAYAKVIEMAPDYESTYIQRARVNKLLDIKDNGENQKGLAIPFYEKFVELVTVTKPEKAAQNSRNLIDAYNNIGQFYANTDKEKAKEYFNKTLALDPQNSYATESLKALSPAPAPAKKSPIKK
ncbi:tetratricopeptide repeat protein [Pedobacter montanisoli]|uniref:Tetratricopeptide repeat protein n=1 Tax=Pedobacter montanisoli TaxID=2923277 RepID=A0ABS9ZTK9_9SPHI|nr:tetratricopeptide repeat protein [Pedobacter montanisoli]MCJ0741920.1 tetratricopeptide repeat protein [Pedobacter montanisoli]